MRSEVAFHIHFSVEWRHTGMDNFNNGCPDVVDTISKEAAPGSNHIDTTRSGARESDFG